MSRLIYLLDRWIDAFLLGGTDLGEWSSASYSTTDP